MPGWLFLYPMLGGWLSGAWPGLRRLRVWGVATAAVTLALAVVVVAQADWGFATPWLGARAAASDVTLETLGWGALSQALPAGDPPEFAASVKWLDAGKIGVELISSYCAAKAGVIGFSKSIASELAPYGTTVNCVCPGGVTATQMGQKVLDWISEKSGKSKEDIVADREKCVPLGRMQTPEDVAGAVVFLISDAGGYITGEALNVDGGGLGTARIRGL